MPHTPPGATHQRFIVCSFICCMQLVLATVHALFCVVYANATKYCGGIYTHTNIALHCLGLAALLWPRLLWPFWWVVCENFIFLYCFCISFFFIAWLGSNDLFALLYFCFFFYAYNIYLFACTLFPLGVPTKLWKCNLAEKVFVKFISAVSHLSAVKCA